MIKKLLSSAAFVACIQPGARAQDRCFVLFHDELFTEVTQEVIRVSETKDSSGYKNVSIALKQYYPVMSYSETEVFRWSSLSQKEVSGGRQYYYAPPYEGTHAIVNRKIPTDVSFYPSENGSYEKGEIRFMGLRLFYSESKCFKP